LRPEEKSGCADRPIMIEGVYEPAIVSEADLECQLSLAQKTALRPLDGLFGPHSLLWKVNRESLIFLAAGRALLLQLAHPWVAAAISDHSAAVKDPLARFHQTFSVMFSMQFGTVPQALRAARRLHRRHAMVQGVLAEPTGPFPAGAAYRANERMVLQWVHATLIESALLAYELGLSPLTAAELEGYYRESCRFAALFGLPSSSLPPDWTAFVKYIEAMCRSDLLAVAAPARVIAGQIFAVQGDWPRPPGWYRAITAQLLPQRLREAYGLAFGEAEQRVAASAIRWIRQSYSLLPYNLRYVGPYQEAQARLSGRATPNVITQALNQFWIGQRWLP
jgi:uncharacterized protein (DUF2236 family)